VRNSRDSDPILFEARLILRIFSFSSPLAKALLHNTKNKKNRTSGRRWLTPIILATQEAEIKRIII
jgi:hypothetical protein